MAFYITYGEFQSHMKSYYKRTGNKLQFPEMTEYLFEKGLLYDYIQAPEIEIDYDNISDEEFDKIVDSLPMSLTPNGNFPLSTTVDEADLIKMYL